MRTLVVPDLHSDHGLALALLVHAGVPLTPEWRAEAGIRTVQLGDLVSCVSRTVDADQEILEKALDWFDVVLLGNHEYPYFGGAPFGGFYRDPAVHSGLRRLYQRGLLYSCLLVGETLLTHAGVTDEWGFTSAGHAASSIRSAWTFRALAPIYAQCGSARDSFSDDNYGGILWSDWSETRAPFRQVHGHTPRRGGPYIRWGDPTGFAINLDVAVGKRASTAVALWLDEDGTTDIVAVSEGPSPQHEGHLHESSKDLVRVTLNDPTITP